jgi:hypothetical protein
MVDCRQSFVKQKTAKKKFYHNRLCVNAAARDENMAVRVEELHRTKNPAFF